MTERKNVTALILAAGSGNRMNIPIAKQNIEILGKTVLERSISAFAECELVSTIIVVAKEEEIPYLKASLMPRYVKLSSIIPGGPTRAESSYNGFLALPPECELVAFHDAARCLVTSEQINKVISAAEKHGAATASHKVSDTIKKCDGEKIVETVNRESLIAAQTPQVIDTRIYREGLSLLSDNLSSVTDDNMVAEAAGAVVVPVETGSENIKITTIEDIEYAEFIISKREKHMTEMRVGHGYDVHRFEKNRRLILGGVEIPYELGLLGHSDADVLVHAIMDSLLGAAGLGDIGVHFPDTSEKYRDISSLLLLEEVNNKILNIGYSICNIDATLVIQNPKISPYIEEMKRNISLSLGVPAGKINIKATTEERLGFTGSGEGVSAHAVASLTKK